MSKKSYSEIEEIAKFIRISALKMTNSGNSSHIACVFSMAELLAELYGNFLNIDPKEPRNLNRDRFILSKGHGGAGVYAALASRGFFEKELLLTHYQNGSLLSGHVSHKGIPGVEFSTGSLGHGMPVSVGMALAGKFKSASYRTICLVGDGECNEGTTWESALIASHHKLNKLTVIVDLNGYQSLKTTDETLNMHPFATKWESFGWDVIEVDGHDIKSIREALLRESYSKPKCILAHTIKGKGVSFMEHNILWHYRSAQGDEYLQALKELQKEA